MPKPPLRKIMAAMHELPWVIETNDAVKRLIAEEIARKDPSVHGQDDLSRYKITVETIQLEIGALRKVKEEAFNFLFQQVSHGQFTEGAAVKLTTIGARFKCKACGHDWDATEMEADLPVCPKCSAMSPETLRGNELNIVGIDFDYNLR